jgi:hypothetical protein
VSIDLGALLDELAQFSTDPYRFVLFAFPWGEAGTELEDRKGPEVWQAELLCSIRDGLLTPNEAIRQATTSGHGVGKSALVSWIILWGISTFEDTRGVVTANTETQLKTKTWAELAKWYRLCLARHLFEMTATAIFSVDREHEKTWRVDMVPWSERNPEAFAGLHNKGKRILIIFDEASFIADVIWETTEGALTDEGTQIIFCVFGNPTKNTGRFKECFPPGGQFAHRWTTRAVDARTVSFTNKAQHRQWIDDYGEDSDFVRVRVLGKFPRWGTDQFIPTELVEAAAKREDQPAHSFDPLIIGVDVARSGTNFSVITFRKGRDARSIPRIRLQGADTMTVASKVVEMALQYRADAVFIDAGGVGGGVVDRCRHLRLHVIEIHFQQKADRLDLNEPGTKFANKRAEMYGMLRAWLKDGSIPDDPILVRQVAAVEYAHNARDEIQLERKEDMMKRIPDLGSPDDADALALTFAYPVAANAAAGGEWAQFKPLVETDYDPLEYAKVA